MTTPRQVLLAATLLIIAGLPAPAAAQRSPWVADISAGDVDFLDLGVPGAIPGGSVVDDGSTHMFAIGGTVRRRVTPRLSVGPELTVVTGRANARDLALLLTANVVFDLYALQQPTAARLTPFVMAGYGVLSVRKQFPTGPSWSRDPAFTVAEGFGCASVIASRPPRNTASAGSCINGSQGA